MKKVALLFAMIVFLLSVAVAWSNVKLVNRFKNKIYTEANELPYAQVALVPGASVTKSKQPSPALIERLERALDLYRVKKIKKILLSGDSEGPYYDEVNVMKDYILQKQVDPKVIFLDHSGLRTLDSVYRSKYIFQIKSMIIVSQAIYLPRALYLAHHYEIESYGYAADIGKFSMGWFQYSRELLARFLAVIDTKIFQTKPSYLGKTISINGDGRDTWNK